MMNELQNLFDELNNIFETSKNETKKTSLKSDVIEYKEGYLVLTDVPGVLKENINVSFDNKVLMIEIKDSEEKKDVNFKLQERNNSFLTKKIYIEKDIDFAKTTAKVENGVLKIYLKKVENKKTSIIVE